MRLRIILLAIITMVVSIVDVMNAQNVSEKKILIAYFSYSGNTQVVAEQIQRATGGDILKIESLNAYPDGYQEVVDQAKKEINAEYRPKLKTKIDDIKQYDVIFIGSPCWWATVAPPVATFLSDSDFSGKTIIPFMTHEGSRMGRTVSDIKKICPDSKVLEGFPVRGGNVHNAEKEVKSWLQKIGVIK